MFITRPREPPEHVSGPAHVARLLLCAGPGLAAACVHYTAATQPGLSAAVQVSASKSSIRRFVITEKAPTWVHDAIIIKDGRL